MDFNSTIDIILKDLREVREIVDDLKNYPGIPLLQIELAKSKCKSAEEVIKFLKTLNQQKAPATIAKEPLSEPEPLPPPANDEKKVKPAAVTEKAAAEEPVRTAEKISSKNEARKTEIREDAREKRTLADSFSGSSNTILDKFGTSGKEDDIASVIKSKPVEKISDAIGINDKFLFIREIFSGNSQVYDEVISRIDSAGSFHEARSIIAGYAPSGEENEVVKQLLEIVKRKLPSDG